VVVKRTNLDRSPTIAVSLGLPSMEPDVWRKDVRRAKERLGPGQILVVSVVGTPEPGGDVETLIADYARCAEWAEEAGADAVEVHLAVPHVLGEPGRLVYESVPLSAQILYRVRTAVAVPIVARLGIFRSPRLLHDVATKLASWVNGFVLVNGIPRRVLDEAGKAAFDEGREFGEIMGASTYHICARQVAELLAWRKAGAWEHEILAVGGITTIERARDVLREGAGVALVDTAAVFDPLFAVRFRQALAAA
jgi:dihydroorotate dehydrogenase (NAD+) catalytic subunit